MLWIISVMSLVVALALGVLIWAIRPMLGGGMRLLTPEGERVAAEARRRAVEARERARDAAVKAREATKADRRRTAGAGEDDAAAIDLTDGQAGTDPATGTGTGTGTGTDGDTDTAARVVEAAVTARRVPTQSAPSGATPASGLSEASSSATSQ